MITGNETVITSELLRAGSAEPTVESSHWRETRQRFKLSPEKKIHHPLKQLAPTTPPSSSSSSAASSKQTTAAAL